MRTPPAAVTFLVVLLFSWQTHCGAVTPQEAAEALDTTGLAWEIEGTGWSVPAFQDYLSLSVSGTAGAPLPFLQTTVTGPGVFRFRARDGFSGDAFSLRVDGHLLITGSRENGIGYWNDWRDVEVSLPPGPHVLRWEQGAGRSYVNLQLDAAAWDPGAVLPAVVALAPADAAQAVWATVQVNDRWTADTAVSQDGAAALFSNRTFQGTARLLRMVEGPALLRWEAMLADVKSGAELSMAVEESLSSVRHWLNVSGPPQWTAGATLMPDGWNVVSWNLETDDDEDDDNVSPPRRADVWLDSFSLREATLADALDTPGRSWRTGGGGGARWSVRPETIGDGEAGSAAPTGNAMAWLETDVTGPAVVTFLSTSGPAVRPLEITVNGLPAALTGGPQSWEPIQPVYRRWTTRTVAVPAGNHVVRLTAQAAAAGSEGGGVLVDRFRVHPLDPMTHLPGMVEASPVFRLPGAWAEDTATLSPSGTAALCEEWPARGEVFFTEVTGPGLLSASILVRTVLIPGYGISLPLEATVDGERGAAVSVPPYDPPGGLWRPLAFWVPPGSHLIGWHLSGIPPAGKVPDATLCAGDFSINRASAVSLAAALDQPGLTWVPSGTVWTTAAPGGTLDGQDAAVLAAGGAVHAQVDGPATISFSHQQGNVKLALNGTPIDASRIPGGAWDLRSFSIPGGGPHSLEITLASGLPVAVDQIQINPPAPSFTEALEAPRLTWNSSGWQTVASAQSADGVDAAVSSGVAEAYLGTVVVGPGRLTFRWRKFASSLFLEVNGALSQFCYSPDWNEVTLSLPAGPHQLVWGSLPGTEGSAWVDQVTWDGGTTPSLEEGSDAPGLAWRTPGQGWFTDPATDTLVWKTRGPYLPADQGWIETTLTGPVVLVYKVQCPEARLAIRVNGADAGFVRTGPDFQTEILALPAGTQTVRWRVRDSGGAAMDDFKLISPNPPAAADTGGVSWDTPDGTPWWAVSLPEAPSANRAWNGWLLLPPPGGDGTLRARVNGTGVFECHSVQPFAVNGRQVPGIMRMALHQEGGDSEIQWRSSRPLFPSMADAVSASFQPHNASPFHAATGTTGGLWITSGADLWEAGLDELHVSGSTPGSASWLQRWFSGPSTVHVTLVSGSGTESNFKLDNGNYAISGFGGYDLSTPCGYGDHEALLFNYPGDARLTHWSETSGTDLPLPEVLESGDLFWRTGGSVPWRGVPALNDARAGLTVEDHALSGTPPPGGDSWMECDITGPGELRFSGRGGDLRVLIDRDPQWTGSTAFRNGSVVIPPGRHVVRFTAATPARVLTAQFLSGIAQDQDAALDRPGPALYGTALNGWSVAAGNAHTGADCLASGGDGSFFTMGLEGPVLASFQLRGVTGAPFFTAKSSAGSQLAMSAVSSAWREALLFSPPGTQWWTCAASGPGLLMDNLRLSTHSVALDEGLDFPGLIVQASGLWHGMAGSAGGEGGDCIAGTPDGAAPVSLTASFAGPGTLSWKHWVPYNPAAAVQFRDNGVPRYSLSTAAGWRSESVFLTAGVHLVQWQAELNGNDATAAILDAMAWNPGAGATLEEAVEAPPALTLTTGGDAAWSGLLRGDAADGTDCATGGTVASGSTSWLEAATAGPAHFDFRCRVTGTSADRLDLSLGGMNAWSLMPLVENPWQSVRAWLPAGGLSLRWTWHPGGTLAFTDEAALDSLSPVTGLSVPEALDAAARPWLTGGRGLSWSAAASGAGDGSACAVCSIDRAGADAWAVTPVRGPALVRFLWSQGTAVSDRIRVSVSGTPVRMISNGPGWTSGEVPVPAGEQTVSWSAFRLSIGGSQPNHVSLDQVEIIATGYGSWAGFRDWPSGLSRTADDPDGDGLTNLMEFASGTDPLARSSSVLDVTMEAGSLTVCLPVPSYDVSGLIWMLETSADLQTWLNAGPLAPEFRPGGPVMCAGIPAGAPVRYARVRVAFK